MEATQQGCFAFPIRPSVGGSPLLLLKGRCCLSERTPHEERGNDKKKKKNLTFAKLQLGAILSRKRCTYYVLTLTPTPSGKASECITPGIHPSWKRWHNGVKKTLLDIQPRLCHYSIRRTHNQVPPPVQGRHRKHWNVHFNDLQPLYPHTPRVDQLGGWKFTETVRKGKSAITAISNPDLKRNTSLNYRHVPTNVHRI